MVEQSIDVLLCERIWGTDYKNHPEYIAQIESIQRGRAASSVNLDLHDRVLHRAKSQRPGLELARTKSPNVLRNGW